MSSEHKYCTYCGITFVEWKLWVEHMFEAHVTTDNLTKRKTSREQD